jgi:hypothetical protein
MSETESTRREFFRTALRVGALGALAGLGALAFKRRGKTSGNYPCGLSGPCSGCPSASDCAVRPTENRTANG